MQYHLLPRAKSKRKQLHEHEHELRKRRKHKHRRKLQRSVRSRNSQFIPLLVPQLHHTNFMSKLCGKTQACHHPVQMRLELGVELDVLIPQSYFGHTATY